MTFLKRAYSPTIQKMRYCNSAPISSRSNLLVPQIVPKRAVVLRSILSLQSSNPVGGLVWRERCEIKGNVSSFLPVENYRFTYRVGEADLVIDAWVFSCEVSQEVLRPTYFIDYPVSKSARMLDFVDADFIDIEFTKNFFNHIMKAGAMNL